MPPRQKGLVVGEANLPGKVEQWQHEMEASRLQVTSHTLHNSGGVNMKSASEIEWEQFLLLRILYLPRRGGEYLQQKPEDLLHRASYVDEAQVYLSGLPGWHKYLDSLKTPKQNLSQFDRPFPGLGTFSLVRYYQLASSGIDSSQSVPKLGFTIQTRSQAQEEGQEDGQDEEEEEMARAAASAFAAAEARRLAEVEARAYAEAQAKARAEAEAQTRARLEVSIRQAELEASPSRQGQIPEDDFMEADDDTASVVTPSVLPTPVIMSPYSPITGEGAANMYKAVRDEQIVNTALLLLLNSLTIHSGDVKGDWTLHRNAFAVKDPQRGKIYEARVDGYLHKARRPGRGSSVQDQEILAIAEVKPFLRYVSGESLRKVKMQEGAQMAAWIFQYPPKDIDGRRKNQVKSRRLLVSKDRQEIYLTVATFTHKYEDYISGNRPPSSAKLEGSEFLKIREYGPYNTGDWKHMKFLGELLVAFAMEQCG